MTDVTVVGGGLAGLVAAITSAETGARVRLYEAHGTLGGRARTLAGPYRANEGTRVFYADGPTWAWLTERGLAGPAARLGPRQLLGARVRYDGQVRASLPRPFLRAITRRGLRAPVNRDFASWGAERLGEDATRAVAGALGVVTYDADPGRLSAAFAWDRFSRVTAPRRPSPRYVLGGWQSAVDRLAAYAERLGVRIESGSRVTELPEPPVVVATELSSARALLGDDRLAWESGHSVLVDLGLVARRGDPFVVSDLDEGGFLERYSSPDPSLAPRGHSLVQAQLPVRAGETKADALARLELLVDAAYSHWRERTTWRRDAVARGRTGALDLPGTTWRDRPAVDRGDGVFLAGDQVAAPGLLSEVAFTSALEAARGAVRLARPKDRLPERPVLRTQG